MSTNPVFKKLVELAASNVSADQTSEQRQRRDFVRKEIPPLLASLRHEVLETKKQISEVVELHNDFKRMADELEELFIVSETGTALELDTLVDEFIQRRNAA
jgi:hypothetical protein